MKFQTQHWKQLSFVSATILCFLFFFATHIVTRELIYKLIRAEVYTKIDSAIRIQTNLVLERMRHQENEYVFSKIFDVYENRVKRDNKKGSLKGLCKAIGKQCSIKNLPGSPGLPGVKGQKGDKGDIGFTGPKGETGPTGPPRFL